MPGCFLLALAMDAVTRDSTAPPRWARPTLAPMVQPSRLHRSLPVSASSTLSTYADRVPVSCVIFATSRYIAGMAELVDGVPARVLAVYAHPDDPEISCGGTLARWARDGAEVHVLICTRGEKGSQDPDQDPDELARLRMDEMDEAAKVLGLAGHERLDV